MSVFFYGCVTLDGYLADKNHGLSWLLETGSSEETDYGRFYQGMDVAIMGRRTFEEIARLEDAASVYPTTDNYVFTHAPACPKRDSSRWGEMSRSLYQAWGRTRTSGSSAGTPSWPRCWSGTWWTI